MWGKVAPFLALVVLLFGSTAANAGCAKDEMDQVSAMMVAGAVALIDKGFDPYKAGGPSCVETNAWVGNDVYHESGYGYVLFAFASEFGTDTDARIKHGDTVLGEDVSAEPVAGLVYVIALSGTLRIELKVLSKYKDVAAGWLLGRKRV